MQQVTGCLSLYIISGSQLYQQREEEGVEASPCMQQTVFWDNLLSAALLSTHKIQHQLCKNEELSAFISKSGIKVALILHPNKVPSYLLRMSARMEKMAVDQVDNGSNVSLGALLWVNEIEEG